jgi:hypothetical protein
MAWVHRKNRFSPADIRTAWQERGALAPREKRTEPRIDVHLRWPAVCGTRETRAGGVSPPWQTKRPADDVHLRRQPVCGTRYARAGGVSPPWGQSACELEKGNPAHCRCRCGLRTHGGLTPAAPGCGFANRSTMFDSHGTASGSPRHGGLTSAALFSVCVGASLKSFFRRQTFVRQHKSGGRKPPVVCSRNANLTTEIPRIAVADAVCEPTAGSRPPLLVVGSLTAGRCSTLTVQRSVHRATAGSRPPLFFGVRLCIEKIVFRRQTFAPQHKSGGRKPPVVCSRNANLLTEITRIAVADAVCEPTAG